MILRVKLSPKELWVSLGSQGKMLFSSTLGNAFLLAKPTLNEVRDAEFLRGVSGGAGLAAPARIYSGNSRIR